jgi:hypothetical protein
MAQSARKEQKTRKKVTKNDKTGEGRGRTAQKALPRASSLNKCNILQRFLGVGADAVRRGALSQRS